MVNSAILKSLSGLALYSLSVAVLCLVARDAALAQPTPLPPQTLPLKPGVSSKEVAPLPVLMPSAIDAVPASTPPAPQPFEPYRLGGGDTISVVVQRFPDLNFQATIDQEGNIIAPLLGRVSFRGMTIEQAQDQIRQGFNRFVIEPIVYLSLSNARPVLVTMTGEIAKPGQYGLTTPRIASALLTAGGATQSADLRSVKIKRSLRDGSMLEETIDLVTPLKNGTALPDLRLQDGDVVMIPKFEGPDNGDRALMARSTFVKPQINVRVLSYASNGLGNLTLPNGSTFVDAITAAKVNPSQADFRKVAIVRFDPVSKKAITREIDAKKVLMGDGSQNLALEDNDVIVVGRNLIGKITYALNTATQPFRDVLGFLLFFKELRSSASNLFGPAGGGDRD